MVKNLPAKQETQVLFLGREDPLEKKMVFFLYSCMENSMDRGAWPITVHRVAKELDMTKPPPPPHDPCFHLFTPPTVCVCVCVLCVCGGVCAEACVSREASRN